MAKQARNPTFAVVQRCITPNCGTGSPASRFQNEKYGAGNRVMNPTAGDGTAKKVRCTCCSTEQMVSNAI